MSLPLLEWFHRMFGVCTSVAPTEWDGRMVVVVRYAGREAHVTMRFTSSQRFFASPTDRVGREIVVMDACDECDNVVPFPVHAYPDDERRVDIRAYLPGDESASASVGVNFITGLYSNKHHMPASMHVRDVALDYMCGASLCVQHNTQLGTSRLRALDLSWPVERRHSDVRMQGDYVTRRA